MDLAGSRDVEGQDDSRKLIHGLVQVASVLIAAVGVSMIVLAELNLQVEEFNTLSLHWSILGVDAGLVIAFLGLNLDLYHARHGVTSRVLVNIATLVPSALIGFSTHQWGRVLELIVLACVGAVLGWFISRRIVHRHKIEGDGLLSAVVRTTLSGMLVWFAALAYTVLPKVEVVP